MSGFPIISVIVPCYNQGRYLGEALDSVLAQTYPHWECILVNDGSTDNTKSVIQDYCSRDRRIRSIEQENKGQSAARNRGLEDIKGDFVQLLDSDDIIAKTKFEKQIDSLKNIEIPAVVYCNYHFGKADNVFQRADRNFPMPKFILKEPLWDLAARWETDLSIPMHCFLFHSSFFRDNQIRFDERLITNEDWDCWMQIFAAGPELLFVPDELATYRLHQPSVSSNKQTMWIGFRDAIKKQQSVFKNDQVIYELLTEKLRQMRVRYGHDPIMNWAKYYLNQSWFNNMTPWPIQKRLMKYIEQRREYRYPPDVYIKASD
ncbi:glycosyltransferase family 2 protein [Lamprobacter modestohalophilus]|uniref:glycosyltransferase family 2 protein n=1 Tax=Lamprobacter modestohalophilus TaxID=1064514 RepID=UPI001903BCA0|nr:glycosyltransferase family 2 protein [Lamprobacter modestohalophilus]